MRMFVLSTTEIGMIQPTLSRAARPSSPEGPTGRTTCIRERDRILAECLLSSFCLIIIGTMLQY